MKLSLKVPARFAPRKPRAAVDIEATLLLPNDEVEAISIRNISAEGFMGEVHADLAVDAWVGVALPGCGILPAQVRWSAEGEIGAQFRKPLDLERLDPAQQADAQDGTLFRARVVMSSI